MPEEVIPQKVQLIIKRGFERMKNYRMATAMFVKEYVGHYYRQKMGLTGEQPINLFYHTLRTQVPNLVMQNPVNKVVTPIIPHQPYAELLSLALNSVDEQIKLSDTLRGWIVSALFGLGIIKVGIAAKGETIKFGDINVDPGQVYAELIDLDDFFIDPVCKDINKSSMYGHKLAVPRQILLDTDGYDHDLVRQMPSSKTFKKDNKTADISRQESGSIEIQNLQDYVDVVEAYVPEADAIITTPDPHQITFDKYLRMTDYYGPKNGGYIFLSFTPPVPGNPLPVAPMSVIYDLQQMTNRTFKKVMNQADRQKDLLLYAPANADAAQDILDAEDGDVVASMDPKAAQVYSFGGQNQKNEVLLQELQIWFNYMAGNPDYTGGNIPTGTKGKETATRSQILQANAGITIEDARNILYEKAAEVNGTIAWYLHTDPLINLPLTKRTTGNQQIQLFLTPEQRQGDFLEYTFNIVARSMSKLDPNIRAKRVLDFCTNILPAAATTAITMMQIGQPFNLQRYLTRMAEEMGITEGVQDLFDDPEFEQKMMIYMSMGPQNAGKASTNTSEGVQQNKGFPMSRNIMTPNQENNQFAQQIAAESQSANQGVY